VKPVFTVAADNRDITAKIADRLVSLRVTDEAGVRSDTCVVALDNGDGAIVPPKTGAELAVGLGYEETGIVRLGVFTVGEVELSAPPRTLTIRAHAAKMAGALKAERTRSFEGRTLGDIVRAIAAEHGYEPKITDDLAAVDPGHLDQIAESDMHFLTRLAKDRGAVAKFAHGFLLFAPQGEAKAVSGKALTPIRIRGGDVAGYTYTTADRASYASVEAVWRDVSANRERIVAAGSGKPVKRLRRVYPNAETAGAAAEAKLARLTRGKVSLNLQLPGRATASAEAPLRLDGLHPEIDAVPWVVDRAVHDLTNRGYALTIDATERTKQS